MNRLLTKLKINKPVDQQGRYGISFCSVSMNRLHHLKLTLPKNIKDNLDYPNIEFIVLDYNSNDGLQDWILSEMRQFIESGLLKFFRIAEPEYFNRCHSRNIAFKKAAGDVICNIDADNYTGPSFAGYINKFFQSNPGSFLTPAYNNRDAMGRLCVKREDFYKISGFNEELEGYGFDDVDIYRRLELNHLRHEYLIGQEFLSVISHTHYERYANEYMGKNIWKIFISYIKPYISEVIFLYKDHSYDRGEILDNEMISAKNAIPDEGDTEIMLTGKWEKGLWEQVGEDVLPGDQPSGWRKNTNTGSYLIDGLDFYELTDQESFDQLILIKTEIDNRAKYILHRDRPNKVPINVNGWGLGDVDQIVSIPGL